MEAAAGAIRRSGKTRSVRFTEFAEEAAGDAGADLAHADAAGQTGLTEGYGREDLAGADTGPADTAAASAPADAATGD